MRWPAVELSTVADVSSGDGAPQEASAFGKSGTPFIRAGSLVPLLAGETEDQLELIPEDESSRRRMRTYPARTIVFAKSGMSCTKGLVYELRKPAHVVNHLAALECGSDLDSRFLLRWFEVNSPARLIANASYPSIKISDIRAERIPLPPLPEQKRIAAILDAADNLRAKRRESLAQLDTLLQSTFLEMFGDPVTNPMGWERVTVAQALERGTLVGIQDGNHGECHPKVADFSQRGIPFIMANCLDKGELNLEAAYRLSDEWRDRLRVGFAQGGDVLLSHKGTIGEVAVVPCSVDLLILSPQVTYYRQSGAISARFLAALFRAYSFQCLLEKEAKQST